MNTHKEKNNENKSRAVAHAVSQKKSNENPEVQVEDNSPETFQMQKLQEMANDSPQVKQLRAYQAMFVNYISQTTQRKENLEEEKIAPIQKKENNTGLPDNLKTGVENLSGFSMDDVKVHYNSDKPAQLNAHAYAQGADIHIASGQEKHLPHEAWHVVQQKQGRVQPTMQMKDKVNINDDAGLETEADVMGEKAMQSVNDQNKNILFEKAGVISDVHQLIAWHDKANGNVNAQAAPDINGVNNTGDTTPINVAGYTFAGPMYSLAESTGADNKIELITDIASQVGAITHPTNNMFLTKNQLETTLQIIQTIPHGNINVALATPSARNVYRGALDPYILRSPGKTKDNEKIALHYQFGRDSYGYIVKIEQEGKLYDMHAGRGQEELIQDQVKELANHTEDRPLFNQFSSAHDTGNTDESISEVASKSTLDKELTLYPASKKKDRQKQIGKLEEKSKRLDAVAKIGGEGARWQCVRKHALNGKLANGSRFYTINHHAAGKGYVGMTFQALWGCWATEFGSAFNIDNGTVISKLLELYDSEDIKIINMKDDDITDNDCSLND